MRRSGSPGKKARNAEKKPPEAAEKSAAKGASFDKNTKHTTLAQKKKKKVGQKVGSSVGQQTHTRHTRATPTRMYNLR